MVDSRIVRMSDCGASGGRASDSRASRCGASDCGADLGRPLGL